MRGGVFVIGAARWAAIVALVLMAAVHGAFVSFSTMVMPAFGRLSGAIAARAMQSINATVLGSSFIPLLFGAPAVLVIAMVAQRYAERGGGRAFPWLVVALVVYVVGVLGVTALGNVPLNEKLALDAPSDRSWQAFAPRWTTLNHARTVASGVVVAAMAIAL